MRSPVAPTRSLLVCRHPCTPYPAVALAVCRLRHPCRCRRGISSRPGRGLHAAKPGRKGGLEPLPVSPLRRQRMRSATRARLECCACLNSFLPPDSSAGPPVRPEARRSYGADARGASVPNRPGAAAGRGAAPRLPPGGTVAEVRSPPAGPLQTGPSMVRGRGPSTPDGGKNGGLRSRPPVGGSSLRAGDPGECPESPPGRGGVPPRPPPCFGPHQEQVATVPRRNSLQKIEGSAHRPRQAPPFPTRHSPEALPLFFSESP